MTLLQARNSEHLRELRSGVSTRSLPAGKFRDAAWAALASWLILALPFLSFIEHNGYPLASDSVLATLVLLVIPAAFIGAATWLFGWFAALVILPILILLFVDFQFNLAELPFRMRHVLLGTLTAVLLLRRNTWIVTSSAFGVMLLSTLVIWIANLALAGTAEAQDTDDPQRLWVHLVLDEHIGIEGIPLDIPGGNELRQDLLEMYMRNGFRIYGGAFSRYYWTRDAIPNLLNFSALNEKDAYVGSRRSPLSHNRYFATMSDRGFTINILATDWLNYCTSPGANIATCVLYTHGGLAWVEDLEASTLCKATLLWDRLSRTSRVTPWAQRHSPPVLAGLVNGVRACHGSVPAKVLQASDGPRLTETLQIIDTIRDLPAGASDSRVVFAHILFPHFPFVSNSVCDLLPVEDWLWPWASLPKDTSERDREEARRRAYEAYFSQAQCTMRKVEEMLKGLEEVAGFSETTIIIHGDHGSRLGVRQPLEANRHELTRNDFMDAFSTLFAVRGPSVAPGYDTRPRAIEELLAEAVFPEAIDSRRTVEPWVYLEDPASDSIMAASGSIMARARFPFGASGVREE